MEALCTDSHDLKRYLELEKFVDDQVESFPATMRAVFLLRSDQFTIATDRSHPEPGGTNSEEQYHRSQQAAPAPGPQRNSAMTSSSFFSSPLRA